MRIRSKPASLLSSTALIPVVGALALMPSQAFAQDATWDGETSTDWATGTNWNTNTVPGVANTVTINNGALANQPVVSTNQSAAQTNINAGTLTLAATLTSPLNISGTGVVRVNAGGNIVGAISVQGQGSLELAESLSSAQITLSGSGQANAGALRFVGNRPAFTANITLVGDARINSDIFSVPALGGTITGTGRNLTLGGNGNLFLFSSINIGNGQIIKDGGSQIALGGANTHGDVFVRGGGVLQVNGGAALDDGATVDVTGASSRLLVTNSETIGALSGGDGALILLDPDQTLTVGANNLSTAFDGSVLGVGALSKIGAGTLTLTGSNSYQGTTTISGGTLQIGNGGTSGTLGTANVVNNAVLAFNRSDDITLANAISGTGSVTKAGAGVLTLSGTNSYAGTTTVSAGTLRITGASGLGSAAGGTTVSSGATLLIVGSSPTLNLGEALTISGTGVNGGGAIRIEPNANPGFQAVNLTGGVTLTGDATITNTDRMLLSFTGTGIDLGTSTLTFNSEQTGNSTTRVNTAITGTGGVTKTGSGVLELNGVNTFTGPLAINGGITSVSGGAALADSVAVTIASGGRFDLVSSETIGSLAGAGQVNIGDGLVLTTGGNDTSTTYAGTIFGANGGSLTKTGTGTFTLTGNNLYTGTTTISGGTLQIGDGGISGTLGSGNVVNNAALAFNRAGTVTVGNVISGSGSLTQQGIGTLVLTAANSYAGGTVIAGGTVVGENAFALGTGAVRFTGNGALHTGNVTSLTVGGVTIDPNVEATLAAAAGRTLTVNGPLLVPALGTPTTLRLGTAGLTGKVRLELNNTVTVTSLRTILQHGTLTFASQGANTLLNALGGFDLQAGTTIDLEGRSGAVTNLEGAGTVTNSGGALSLFAVRMSGSTTFSGVIEDDTAAIRVQFFRDSFVPGTIFTLTGNNTYSGSTSFRQINGVDPTSGILQIGDGGTTGSLGTGAIEIDRGHLRFNRSDNVVLANALTTIGDLVNVGTPEQFGSGTLILTGSNTARNTTLITNGTLQVGDGGTTGNLGSGTVTNNAILAFNRSDDITYAGVIGGTGSLTKLGGGNLTLTGANTYSGLTTVSEGTLTLTGNPGLGTFSTLGSAAAGTIVEDGATLAFNGSGTVADAITLNGNGVGGAGALRGLFDSQTLTGLITLATDSRIATDATGFLLINGGISGVDRTVTFDTAGAIIVFGGLATGSGSVIKEGTGLLGLLGNNTFTGDFHVKAGFFETAGGNVLSDTGRLIIDAGATGQMNGQETVGALEGAGQLILRDSGRLTVAGSQDTIFSGQISETISAGGLTRSGTGRLTLSGNNSYTGLTTVSGGTLAITHANALGTTAAGTTVTSGGTLLIVGSSATLSLSEALTISGTGQNGAGAIRIEPNANPGFQGVSLGGGVTLTGDATITTTDRISLGFSTSGISLGSSTLTFNSEGTGNSRTQVDRVISGTGGVTKTGRGSLTFLGQNTFTGPLVINGGDLTSTDNGIADSVDVTVAAGARWLVGFDTIGSLAGAGTVVLDTILPVTFGANNTSTTFAGSIQGMGRFFKAGTGTFTLTGANTYAGPTLISGGTLQLGDGGTTGSITSALITNNATLAFNRSNSLVYNGTINGSGVVRQIGTGTTTLGGDSSSFTGTVNVEAGILRVNGTLGGTINVTGGTLGGTGTLGALTVGSGGVLAAGNSPGTMTVASLTLNSGSLTSFELGEAGVAGGPNNDLIRVTGLLTLNGGNIEIVQNSGFSNGRYTLFEFGSLSGPITNLTLNPLGGGFVGTLALDGTTIILNAAPPEDLTFWNGSTTSPTGAVVGGSGTWNLVNGNFTENDGIFSGAWAGNGFNAVFAGTGGTVTIAADTTVAPSGLAFQVDGYTITGGNAASRLELTGPTGIDTAAGVGATVNAVISGAGSLTKTGEGTLTLGGVNTYTGDTSVIGGTLVNSGTIAGIVRNFAGLTSTGTLAGELINNVGATANLAGSASTISNSGVLTITGNLGATGNFFNVPSGTVTVNAGATANITGDVSNQGTAANAFTINGTLSATGSFSNQFGGNLLIAAGGTLSATGGIINAPSANLVNNGTIASSIFSQGSFTSTGTLQAGLELGSLSATADIEGVVMGTVTNPGTINLTGTTTGITLFDLGGFGTFNLNGFSTSLGSLTGGGTVNMGAGTLTVGSANTSTTFGGTINGTGGLIKEGTGTFTLTGENFYTGQTRVDAGTLALGFGGLITGRVRNDSIFTNAGTVSGGVTNTATLTSTGTVDGGLTQFGGATATLSGTLNGFVNNGGSVTVNGNLASNDFGQSTGTSQIQINAGARWSGLLGFTNLSTIAAGMTIAGTLDVSGIYVTQAGATTVISSGGTLRAQNSSNLGTTTNNGTVNTDVTNSGTITNSGIWNGILSQGTGSVTNNGTWNGNFLLDAGGTITNNGTWDTTSPFGSSLNNGTFDNNGTLRGNGFFVTGATARLNNNTGGVISLTAGQAFNISSGGTLTNAGSASAIANVNAGGILRNNAGASWTGAVNIAATGSATNAGVITGNVGNAGSFTSTNVLIGTLTNNAGGTASLVGLVDGNIINNGTITLTGTTVGIDRVTVNTGGIFDLAGFSTTFGGLAGSGGEVRLGSATLTVDTTAGSTAFAGAISGSGGLTKTGTQTLTLSGANTFAGLTTISGGALVLSGSLAGAVLNNASFTNSGTVNGLVTNAATLTSSGTLAGGLTNNAGASANLRNTVNGTITNAGTITLTGNLVGGAALSQQATGAFNLAGFTATLGSIAGSGSIDLGSGLLFTGGNNSSTTFDGVIGGTGGLVKQGTGTLKLTGVNDYTGDTQVSAGALTLAAGGVIAGRVRNFATFTNAGTVSGGVSNSGTFASTGTVNGGLTQLAGATATVSGTLNGAIDSDGALVIDGNLAGNGILTNSGTGTVQVLSGVSVTGLAGIDNASTAANGFVISGSLQTTGTVINRAGATLTVGLGASLEAANMANFGTLTNSGTLTSDVTNSGTIQNDFIWIGNLSQGTGSTTNGGSWSGAFLIDAGGVVTNNASWSNTTGFLSAVNNGLFENFGLLSGGGVNVTGAEARLANRAGGTVTLASGQLLRAESGGIISNAGIVTGGGQVNAGGVIQNLAGGSWSGAFSVAATGSLTNAGSITGNILNFGSFASNDTVNGMLVNEAGASADIAGNFNGDIANAGSVTLTGITNGIGIVDQSSTGAFDLAGFDTTIGGLSGGGLVLLRDGDLTVRSASRSTTFLGEISGTGNLVKTGSFNLSLNGANSFTGLTTVNQGGLVLGSTGSLAGSVRNNATTISSGMIGGSVTNFGLFVNAGRILGSLTNNATVQLAGQIDGSVTNDGSITNIGGAIVLGRFTQGVESSLNLAGFNSRFGSLAGGGTIALGSAFLTVGTDNTSSTFDGVISGTGGLVKVGTGSFTLTGVNTYTGTTFVDAGTLIVGEGAGVAPPPPPPPAPETTAVAAPTIVSTQSESGRGLLVGGLSHLTGGRTSVTLAADTETAPEPATLVAAVAGEAPAAPFAEVAAQATMLAPAVIAGNVVNSATLINNGTILGMVMNNAGASATNHGVIRGAVRNDGTLVSTGTLGGGLANNGQAQIAGVLDGDVINTGTITLTGTTTGIDIFEQAAEGTLDLAGFDTTIGAITGAGEITLGAARLTTGTDGVGTVFGGVISGTGSLAKVGTGRLVLTGTNTYAGGTTISGGVLQLGNGGTTGSIIGPVVNNGALFINRSNAYTFDGAISGTGMFVQDGTGTTTLTGANTYSGGTLVSRGRLVGNTTSLQGQIQNNAALEFAQATSGTFAGQLFGAGLFDKTGLGLLTLTGNSNGFTGGTFVRAGELRVTGALANSVVTVLSGSTLSGSGTIGGLVANSGSTIAPGANGAGVLGVNGAVNLQAGSTLQLQISANGPSDAIVSNGAATLGGTVAFSNLGGAYVFGSEIVLLQADGGRTGTFAGTTGFAGFGILYRPELVYTATQARLRLAPNLLANVVGNTALTANQRSVVNRIDGAVTAGYNPQRLFNIYALPTAQLPGAFDQLSGEVYATAAGVGIEQERLVREAVLGRVNSVAMAARGDAAAGQGLGAWGQVFGGRSQIDNDGNAAFFKSERTGFATGIDFGNANENGSWRAGLFGMLIESDVTIDARGSSAEVEQSGGGVYASLTTGGFSATLGGYLTSVDLTASRAIALPGFAELNSGATDGEARQAFAELSYAIPAGKGTIRPFVGATIGSFDLDAFTETGGAAALTMRDQSYATGTLTAGIDGIMPVGRSLTLFGSLAGRAQLGDRDPQAQLALAAAPQQAFGVAGAQFDEVAIAARLDAEFKLGKAVDLSLGYTGLVGSTVSDHGVRASLQVQF
ncbi:autotransporter-associated beta strand repeat-containing protein [Erythrobacter oryzae]|uniref:autotransporter-associated beta strand repeat-containing protein n=1 Tax=Erythrobacter oryzae TaxID=3019556 RepID=UPI0025557C8A|nr:autotransporter-associated beta strand repeat-containing protein [Erythrobacter sp. COR-2]